MSYFKTLNLDSLKNVVVRLNNKDYVNMLQDESIQKMLLSLYEDEMFCRERLSEEDRKLINPQKNITASLICKVNDLMSIKESLPLVLIKEDPKAVAICVNAKNHKGVPELPLEFFAFKYSPKLYTEIYTFGFNYCLRDEKKADASQYLPYAEFVVNNPDHLDVIVAECLKLGNFDLIYNTFLTLIPEPKDKTNTDLFKKLASVLYKKIDYYACYELLITLNRYAKEHGYLIKELSEDFLCRISSLNMYRTTSIKHKHSTKKGMKDYVYNLPLGINGRTPVTSSINNEDPVRLRTMIYNGHNITPEDKFFLGNTDPNVVKSLGLRQLIYKLGAEPWVDLSDVKYTSFSFFNFKKELKTLLSSTVFDKYTDTTDRLMYILCAYDAISDKQVSDILKHNIQNAGAVHLLLRYNKVDPNVVLETFMNAVRRIARIKTEKNNKPKHLELLLVFQAIKEDGRVSLKSAVKEILSLLRSNDIKIAEDLVPFYEGIASGKYDFKVLPIEGVFPKQSKDL
jgi:hypothetical protein